MSALWIIGGLIVVIGASAFFGAPYIPTRRQDLRGLFEDFAPLTKTDTLLDIGSGDGVVLREASKAGARAVGFEINPVVWAFSKLASRKTPRVHIILANSWVTAFPADTTIVYIFSVSRDVARLKKQLMRERQRLGKPIKVITYGAPLPKVKPLKQRGPHCLYQL